MDTTPPVTTPPHHSSPRIIILLLLFILIVSAVVVIIRPHLFRGSSPSLSPYILEITQPIYSLSGTVQKVSNNSITLSYQPGAITGKSTSPLTFEVLITPKTVIQSSILPTLNASSSAKPSFSLKDVQVGQVVTITSSQDLRTLSGNQFEAVSINLPAPITNLFGTLTKVSGDVITVSAILPPLPGMAPSQPQTKNYQIKVTSHTIIEKANLTSALPGIQSTKPQSLALSDLKKGMQLNITTGSDVTTSTNLEATQIKVISVPLPTSPLPATGSGTATSSSSLK